MFEHSVRVPRLYKEAATIARKVKDEGASIKGLVFEKRHPNVKGLYSLVVETLQRFAQLDFLFKKSQLLSKESRLDPWLARILITELLWGKKRLPGESRPIKTILAYQQILQAHSNDIHEVEKVAKVVKPRFVRVNTLKLSVNEAVDGFRDEGWTFIRANDLNYENFLTKVSELDQYEFMVDLHLKDMLVFPPNTPFYKHNAYLDGSILLQDKASCLPVQVLNPPPGSVVLDMCAAPGMKTTQMAALLENTGTIYAVEKDMKRMETLKKLVDSAGATCVKTINRDVLTLTATDAPDVQYILVDPSCSGSGINDRIDIETNEPISAARLDKLAGFQIKILKHAFRSFPDVKRVVYSTCSIYPRENEEVVREVISSSRRFKLVSARELLEAPWLNFGSPEYGEIGGRCLYAKPADDLTNGFFVAVFDRLGEGEVNDLLVESTKKIREEEMKGKWGEVEDVNVNEEGQDNGDKCEIIVDKKKQRVDSVSENMIITNDDDKCDKIAKKKSKKKKGLDSVSEDMNITNGEDKCDKIVRKKSKKKKGLDAVCEDMDITNNEDKCDKIIKKKSKNSVNLNIKSEDIKQDEDNDSLANVCHKKNKKKMKHLEDTIDNNHCNNNEESTNVCIDIKKDKKKKKHHSHVIEDNLMDYSAGATEETNNTNHESKKKKKKGKHTLNDSVLDCTEIEESETQTNKKSKKNKYSINSNEDIKASHENLSEDGMVMDTIPIQTNKRKKSTDLTDSHEHNENPKKKKKKYTV